MTVLVTLRLSVLYYKREGAHVAVVPNWGVGHAEGRLAVLPSRTRPLRTGSLVLDLLGLAQCVHRLVDGQEDCRFERANRTATAKRHPNGSHRDVVGGFPKVVAVVGAKGVPETVELPADGLDVRLGGLPAVLWVADQPGPSLRRVAELREIERHCPSLLLLTGATARLRASGRSSASRALSGPSLSASRLLPDGSAASPALPSASTWSWRGSNLSTGTSDVMSTPSPTARAHPPAPSCDVRAQTRRCYEARPGRWAMAGGQRRVCAPDLRGSREGAGDFFGRLTTGHL